MSVRLKPLRSRWTEERLASGPLQHVRAGWIGFVVPLGARQQRFEEHQHTDAGVHAQRRRKPHEPQLGAILASRGYVCDANSGDGGSVIGRAAERTFVWRAGQDARHGSLAGRDPKRFIARTTASRVRRAMPVAWALRNATSPSAVRAPDEIASKAGYSFTDKKYPVRSRVASAAPTRMAASSASPARSESEANP